MAAIRTSGLTAPTVLDGPMNGEFFLAYVEQQLIPTLRPGELVIKDNLSSHKQIGVRKVIESVGASLLFLPPYSPDLNPIELAFSKFKTILRKHAERNIDALWKRIGEMLDQFPESECRNDFKHCGYT